MKKILIVISFCLFFCGCENQKQNPNFESNKLEAVIKENNYIIIDVRTKEEYDINHLVGAMNIPLDEIDDNLELDNTKTILVYCQSGNRSSMAYNYLINLGYTVYDLGAFNQINLPKE